MSTYQYCENVIITLHNHEIYHSKVELEERIAEITKQIEEHKLYLFAMCCSNPKEIMNSHDCEQNPINPIDAIKLKFDSIVNEDYDGLESLIIHRMNLQYMYDNWDNMHID